MNDGQPLHNHHPPLAMVASYALGTCSVEEQALIDDHCFACEDCRAQLTILLRVCAAGVSEAERRQLERLFPLGVEAVAQARHQPGASGPEAVLNGRQSLAKPSSSSSPNRWRRSDLWAMPGSKRKILIPAMVLAAVILGGALYFWIGWLRSPVQNGLSALRQSYRFSRPLEARITGGFAYQPYERQRGESQEAGIDRDQLNYALAELTRAVASQPTPEARHALGRLYLLIGEFDQAEEQMALALKDSPRNARLHADVAALYYERSKHAEPFQLLSKAVEHYNSAIDIEPQLAEAWFNRALCREQMALFTEARKDWERYLEIDPDSPWAAEAREHLKKLQSRATQSPEQNRIEQATVKAAVEANDESELRRVVSRHFVAVKQIATGRLFDEYLDAAVKGEAAVATERLNALKRLGNLTAEIKGDRYVADLTDFATRASPSVKQGMQRVRLGLRQADEMFNRGFHDAAFKFYSTAYQAAERIGDQCHAETAAFNLIRYYNLRPNTNALASLGNRLVSKVENLHHRQLQAQTLFALANAYAGSQQFSQSLEFSLPAARIASELDDAETSVAALRSAGAVYSRSGDYDRAVSKNFEAVALMHKYHVPALKAAQACAQLSDTLFRKGEYAMALDYQMEAIQYANRTPNAMLAAGIAGRLGLIYWKLGRDEEANRYLNDAIARTEAIADRVSRSLLQIDLYTALGDFCLHRHKVAESISAYQRAIKTVSNTNNRVFLSAIHQGLAEAYLAQGKIAEAEPEFQTSIRLAERDRQQINDAYGRSLFLASRQNVYHAMIDFQFSSKRDPVKGFNYSEVAKSRELLDTMAGQNRLKSTDGNITLALSGGAQPLTLNQVQRALPATAQIVSYTVAKQRLMVWLVTRDDFHSARIDISADRLRRLTSDYLANLRTRRNLESLKPQAAELYKILISPLAARLDRNRMLYVVPDAVLSQVPFVSLVTPDTNRYLIEDFPLAVAPSASVLARTLKPSARKPTNGNEAFLGIGNPRFNHQRFPGLPALPSADDEINQSKSFYPRALSFNREQATESALTTRMGDYEIVHIAAHVLIDEQSPLHSSIVLAEEKNREPKAQKSGHRTPDGKLQAHEIFRLKLPRTRLVILSGCRSALGSGTRAEALSALAQAFLAAGAKSVIASLWDVDDQSAAELMQSFHQYHRAKRQALGEALRQAQVGMIRSDNSKWQHPYYWAAFMITGDGWPSDSSRSVADTFPSNP
jgi:CHAT domain-containing protein